MKKAGTESILDRELADLPRVAEVRGMGLLLACELDDGVDARVVQAEALAAGLVVNAVSPTALRLAPPLTVSGEEIDEALAILRTVLAAQPHAGADTEEAS